MNRENIQATIDILKRAQNFCVTSFQGSPTCTVVKTEEELHACGNTACIAGYVALSNTWRDFGGYVCKLSGAPTIKDPDDPAWSMKGGTAMAHFWGVDNEAADNIVYGEYWPAFVLRNNLADVVPDLWEEMTKEHAIAMFEHFLRAGEIKPAVSYGD